MRLTSRAFTANSMIPTCIDVRLIGRLSIRFSAKLLKADQSCCAIDPDPSKISTTSERPLVEQRLPGTEDEEAEVTWEEEEEEEEDARGAGVEEEDELDDIHAEQRRAEI